MLLQAETYRESIEVWLVYQRLSALRPSVSRR
jgi:hypothetical protein